MAQGNPTNFGNEKCSLCKSDFVQPKLLPCQHKFCMTCLKGHCDKIDEEEKPCPLCSKEFHVPDGGVEMLEDVDITTRQVDLGKGRHKLSKCEICEHADAEVFCMECKQNLCAGCRQSHRKVAATKDHTIVGIDEKPNEIELDERIKTLYCDKHRDKKLELYCCDCKKPLCNSCLVAEHNKHSFSNLSDEAESKCEKLVNDQRRLANCIEEQQAHMEARAKVFSEKLSTVESLIINYFHELSIHLEIKKSKLLQQLPKLKKETEVKKTPSEDDELNSFLSEYKTMLERHEYCEIVRMADYLHHRVVDSIKSQEESKRVDRTTINLNILERLKSNIEEFRSTILRTDIDRFLDLRKQFPCQSTFREVKLEKPVTGVVVVDGELYLVQFEIPDVKVYDWKEKKEKTFITVDGMKAPRGLVGCSQDKALYIIDNKEQCLFVININDKNMIVKHKIKYDNPRGIGMTTEGNILVTICDRQSVVLEYTKKGQLVREITLDESITEAYQIIPLSIDQFIVSHGEKSAFHRICVLSNDYKIVKSYGREKGRGDDQLHVPRSLAMDNNSGILFVADQTNDRVLMFDKNLNPLGQVQTPGHLVGPSRLFFDSASARLFIADSNHLLFIIEAADQ